MGTPDFAVPSLKAIHESRHRITGVISQPDRPRGRGRKLQPTPVKQFALDHSLAPILQPERMKDPAFLAQLAAIPADIFVVVAFRILPEVVFAMPPKGTVNLHPSLLPKFRGAAPLHWTIINGETETGLSTIFIQKEIDAGNIILQEKRPVFPSDTTGTLHDRIAPDGAEFLVRTLDLIENDAVKPQRQDPALATPAPKLHKTDCHISFDQPATRVRQWIQGLSPFPGAFVYWEDQVLKLYRATVVRQTPVDAAPGTIVRAEGLDLHVACNPGVISLDELKLQGRKMMTAEDFLRGTKISEGSVLT